MLKKFRGVMVMLKECFAMSLRNIMSNRVRSFLTVLGILIGVTAVIALITTVSGFSGTLSSSFLNMGAGTLTVSVTGSDLKSGLTAEDLKTLAEEIDAVEGVTPTVSFRTRVARNSEYKTNVTISGKNTYLAATRIGRGSVAHADPKAYAGSGSIVRFLVNDGDEVKKGDPLFETLSGQFDRFEMTGSDIASSVSGIVKTVSVTPGVAVEKGAAAAEIYPDDALRVEVSVSETNLRYLPVGSKVTVEFPYLQESIVTVEGTVERVSFLNDGVNPDAGDESESSGEAYYLAYIAFAPVDGVRIGMSAVVTSAPDALSEARE